MARYCVEINNQGASAESLTTAFRLIGASVWDVTRKSGRRFEVQSDALLDQLTIYPPTVKNVEAAPEVAEA